MKVLSVIVLLMAGAIGAGAQNTDIGFLIGASHYPTEFRVGGQVNYARQLQQRPIGRLYLELPVFVPVIPRGVANSTRVFVTPGFRYHLNVTPRLVLYGAIGAGFAVTPQAPSTGVAFVIGGGVDYRVTRRWSWRADVRDFWASGGNGFGDNLLHSFTDTGNSTTSLTIGAALHF